MGDKNKQQISEIIFKDINKSEINFISELLLKIFLNKENINQFISQNNKIVINQQEQDQVAQIIFNQFYQGFLSQYDCYRSVTFDDVRDIDDFSDFVKNTILTIQREMKAFVLPEIEKLKTKFEEYVNFNIFYIIEEIEDAIEMKHEMPFKFPPGVLIDIFSNNEDIRNSEVLLKFESWLDNFLQKCQKEFTKIKKREALFEDKVKVDFSFTEISKGEIFLEDIKNAKKIFDQLFKKISQNSFIVNKKVLGQDYLDFAHNLHDFAQIYEIENDWKKIFPFAKQKFSFPFTDIFSEDFFTLCHQIESCFQVIKGKKTTSIKINNRFQNIEFLNLLNQVEATLRDGQVFQDKFMENLEQNFPFIKEKLSQFCSNNFPDIANNIFNIENAQQFIKFLQSETVKAGNDKRDFLKNLLNLFSFPKIISKNFAQEIVAIKEKLKIKVSKKRGKKGELYLNGKRDPEKDILQEGYNDCTAKKPLPFNDPKIPLYKVKVDLKKPVGGIYVLETLKIPENYKQEFAPTWHFDATQINREDFAWPETFKDIVKRLSKEAKKKGIKLITIDCEIDAISNYNFIRESVINKFGDNEQVNILIPQYKNDFSPLQGNGKALVVWKDED